MSGASAVELAGIWAEKRPTMGMKHFCDGLIRQAMSVARELRLRDEVVHSVMGGSLPDNGGPLTVHYLGRRRFADDFLAFFDRDTCGNDLRQEFSYTANYLRFIRERGRMVTCPDNADVLVVDSFLTNPDAKQTYLAPHINAVLPLQKDLESQLAQVRSKGHRRKLQAAYKRGFSWRKSQSAADFDLFYDVMYAPFVQERFRYGASVVPREEMFREYMRRGFLLLLQEGETPVSGAFMYTSSKRPGSLCYWKYGLSHAKELTPALFGERNSITEAMVLQYAVNEKFTELDFGLTRSMPEDGIFVHKKRLGCDFRLPPGTPQFALHLNPKSRPRFLSRCPLIVNHQGGLHAWAGQTGDASGKAGGQLEERLSACVFSSLQAMTVFSDAPGESSSLVASIVERVQKEAPCAIGLETVAPGAS